MSYLIVPSRVTADAASVWIGAIDEPARPALFADGVQQPPPQWAQLRGGPHTLAYARVQITGLAARTRCDLQLRVGDRVVAVGSVTTLPAHLPTETEQPFTVLLGSCFHVANDRGVGAAFARLPSPAPDIKILCGDQVYLDAPWTHFLAHTHGRGEMERMFFESYQRTWEQAGANTGFRMLLQDGANYLSSDDHEFWNNAPTFGVYVRDSWTQGGRDNWWAAASALFYAFQDDRPIEVFSIDNISFCLADTRHYRDSDRDHLMRPIDWDWVCAWVRNLQGPGVLVLGQPIFAGKGGFWDRFKDWNLADFKQYDRLVTALQSARHSVVVLTGDVHFGRVAYCQLPPSPSGFSPRLIEVIASPLALVDSKAGGGWSRGPDRFPAYALAGAVGLPINPVTAFQMAQDHFLTLELVGVAGGARMRVKSWPIVPSAAKPFGQQVFEDTLY